MSETIYELKVFFIDDTYWDDGNRYAHRAYRYLTLKEAHARMNDILENGLTTMGLGGIKTFRIEKDEIHIHKLTREKEGEEFE